MAKLLFFVLMLIIASFFGTLGLPTPDEERYFDKEYNRELINWLTSVQAYPPQFNNPCKYYSGNTIAELKKNLPKRNSELINSLLSLPKNMNDAGK